MDFLKHKPFPGFSVDDSQRAKDFYSQVLGFGVDEHEGGMLWIKTHGDDGVLAYPKGPAHEPASFTILNIPVDDVKAAVDELRSRGVRFERYDEDELKTNEDGIADGMGAQIAWFKDPAGNILSVIEAAPLPHSSPS